MKPENLPAIWTLIQVIDKGSLSAAAQELGISPSGVSKQLSRLEAQLGARLLTRTTRRVRPTEEGIALYDRCRPLFDALDEAEEAVRTMRSSLSGHLRMSATPALGRARLVPAIAEFTERHPELTVELDLSARRVDLVEEGLDLAVREGPLPSSSLIATRLGEIQIMLCASPDYIARRGTPSTLSDLERFDIISVPAVHSGLDLGQSSLPDKARINLRPRIIVNDLFAIRELAREGRGIAPLPDYLLEDDLDHGRLVRILPDLRWPATPVTALVPERRFQPNRVRALLDFLVEHFRMPKRS